MQEAFWKTKDWNEFSMEEWESLCDHCGKCCLEKLENFSTKEIFFTSVACIYLDVKNVKCKHYSDRFNLDVDCTPIKNLFPEKIHYLPKSCAYRLVYDKQDLPEWHPLISGNPLTTIESGNSVKNLVVKYSPELELEDYIIFDNSEEDDDFYEE